MKIAPIKPYIGVTVFVDKSVLNDADVVARTAALLEEHCLIVFPRLSLNEREQIAFTNQLGSQGAGTRDFKAGKALGNDTFELSLNTGNKIQSEIVKTSYFWHVDGLNSDEAIPKGTLLQAVKVAEEGGQTEFASLFAAYEQLSDREKSELQGLRALHTVLAGMRNVLEDPTREELELLQNNYPAKSHAIVVTHASGRKSLNVGISADTVVGMPAPEGRALLSRLLEWTVQPEFKYRHYWEAGDLVLWNNHATLHRAIPYDPASGRLMRRTSYQCETHQSPIM